MKRRIWKLLGAAAVVGGVMAPTAALAEGDYPTPPSTPTASAEQQGRVSGAQASRSESSGGSTLPFTGGEIAALALAGAGVTGAGVVLVGFGRRHRAQIQS